MRAMNYIGGFSFRRSWSYRYSANEMIGAIIWLFSIRVTQPIRSFASVSADTNLYKAFVSSIIQREQNLTGQAKHVLCFAFASPSLHKHNFLFLFPFLQSLETEEVSRFSNILSNVIGTPKLCDSFNVPCEAATFYCGRAFAVFALVRTWTQTWPGKRTHSACCRVTPNHDAGANTPRAVCVQHETASRAFIAYKCYSRCSRKLHTTEAANRSIDNCAL